MATIQGDGYAGLAPVPLVVTVGVGPHLNSFRIVPSCVSATDKSGLATTRACRKIWSQTATSPADFALAKLPLRLYNPWSL
jgi:hypothetical protein